MSALGCTAAAFEDYGDGDVLFVPFGRIGSAYAARDSARTLTAGVRFFCALATLIVGAWLVLLVWQRLDPDPDRWRFGYALAVAFVLWFLAYVAWVRRATDPLTKVRG